MAAGKSVVPAKLQIPMAIVLGLLLVCIVVVRFGGRKQATPAVTVKEKTNVTAEETITIEDLRQALTDLPRTTTSRVGPRDGPPPLVRNPFVLADSESAEDGTTSAASEGGSEEGESAPVVSEGETDKPSTPAEPAEDRSVRLARLSLSATSLTKNSAVALINGRYVREGDVIEGFVVKKIHERKVLLEDQVGIETVRMPETIDQ